MRRTEGCCFQMHTHFICYSIFIFFFFVSRNFVLDFSIFNFANRISSFRHIKKFKKNKSISNMSYAYLWKIIVTQTKYVKIFIRKEKVGYNSIVNF